MNTVQWWCSARLGQLWTWEFQAYPGIWLFVASLLAAYGLALRAGRARGHPPVETRRLLCFGVGWALLWGVLDWPVGPLAAGYLLTAHMAQYMLISLVIAPLLDAGMPRWMVDAPGRSPALRWIPGLVARPAVAFGILNAVMLGTHLPAVADRLKPLQFGSMLMDWVWIAAAMIFWWSIRADAPGRDSSTRYGVRMLYIAGVKMVPIFLGAFLVFAEFPLFRTFELATRATALSAVDDQLLAGVLMWMGTTPILIYRLAHAWFSWVAAEPDSLR